MSVTEAYVRTLFEGLGTGDGATFFEHVDDNVDWTVEGTHPLAGRYRSRPCKNAFGFARIGSLLEGRRWGVSLRVKTDGSLFCCRIRWTIT
jgi:ketosteroid isomerase-like protein